jgi:hypothetical protein
MVTVYNALHSPQRLGFKFRLHTFQGFMKNQPSFFINPNGKGVINITTFTIN